VKGFILLADIYVAEDDYFQARATLQGIQEAYDGDQALLDEIGRKLDALDALENGSSEDSMEEESDENNDDSEEPESE